MTYWATNWQLWVSAFCVLAIYSYLYKDNPLYRTMVQIFIGIQVGYNVIVQWRDILYPRWWLPMLDGFDAILLGGTGSPWGALWALAGLLGLLWYFQLSRKYLWLSRIVIGVVIGIGAGITFKTQIGTNLPQLTDTFKPLAPAAIGPQPIRLYTLPATTVPPAFSDNLGIFANGADISCLELLNGKALWRARLPAGPERVTLADEITAWRSNRGMKLELATGRSLGSIFVAALPQPKVDVTGDDFDVRATRGEQTLEEGIVVVGAGGKPILVQLHRKGLVAINDVMQEVWSRPFKADFTLFSNFTFVAAEGSTLRGIDLATGKDTFTLQFGSRITAQPVLAKMKEPVEDQLYAVTALANGALVAAVVKDAPGLNRQAGEVLWSARLGKPVKYQRSEQGVVLLSGPEGGAAYELPRPTKKLEWTDYVNNWIFVFTVIAVMTYFFFSFKQSGKPVQWTATYGRWALMIAFGAFFGNTVMTRMSYLLDRLMFLIDDWLKPMF